MTSISSFIAQNVSKQSRMYSTSSDKHTSHGLCLEFVRMEVACGSIGGWDANVAYWVACPLWVGISLFNGRVSRAHTRPSSWPCLTTSSSFLALLCPRSVELQRHDRQCMNLLWSLVYLHFCLFFLFVFLSLLSSPRSFNHMFYTYFGHVCFSQKYAGVCWNTLVCQPGASIYDTWSGVAPPRHLCSIRFQKGSHCNALPPPRCPMHLIQALRSQNDTWPGVAFLFVCTVGPSDGTIGAWFIRLMSFASNLLLGVQW